MFEKVLENIGIKVINEISHKEKNNIVNQVSEKLLKSFPDAKLNYTEIYNTLINTPMYYAEIPEGLSKVNYFYKNSSIYFSKDIDINNLDEFVFHEFIHRLQECKDKKGNLIRFGLCEVNEITVKATALNEAAIQYIIVKALELPTKNVNVYGITMPSKTEYYPILTNIITQIGFLLGRDDILVDSTINGNEEFKYSIMDNIGESQYFYIERNLNKILKTKDYIMELQKNVTEVPENTKLITENQELIKNLYFDIQNTIFISYFDKTLKKIETDIELKWIMEKINSYKMLIGNAIDYDIFELYFSNFTKRVNEKAERLKAKNSLMIIKENVIVKLLKKIKSLFTNSETEYYK